MEHKVTTAETRILATIQVAPTDCIGYATITLAKITKYMPDINLQPLFTYLDQQFDELKNEQKQLRQSMSILTTAVDKSLQASEVNKQEIIFMRERLKRHDEWFQAIRQQLNMQLQE